MEDYNILDFLEFLESKWIEAVEAIRASNDVNIMRCIVRLEEKAKTSSIRTEESSIFLLLAIICNEAGVVRRDYSYLNLASAYFRFVDKTILPKEFIYRFNFRKGRNLFYEHLFKKNISKNKNEKFKYYESIKTYIFDSQNYLQNVFVDGILTEEIRTKSVKNYTLQHMAFIAGELNRWVEFPYYLSFVDEEFKDESYYSMYAFNLDAYAESAHANVNSTLIFTIIDYCKMALASKKTSEINKKQIEELVNKKTEIIRKYNIPRHSIKEGRFSKYRKWTLNNNLGINEHSIYCKCQLSAKDQLKIRTTNSHTKKRWASKYQILIDQLIIDFDFARKSYFYSLESSKTPKYSSSYQTNKFDPNILAGFKPKSLINSFKQTYAILDRIAVSLWSIYDLDDSKGVYFHDFSDYIKKKIYKDEKPYLIALESIAREIQHNNPIASIIQYKEWRDAIEHNFFFLLEDNSSQDWKMENHSWMKRSSFEEEGIFRRKTFHLLQLCRSAIFSLVFLIRDECCKKFFNH